MTSKFTEFCFREWRWLAAMSTIVAVVIFIHLWQLDSLPRGLYVDESSIGLNAADIAHNLHDEHGKFLPIYFEAFGEYKNPIYIYTAAALFKLFGVSVWMLRLTSFWYFATFMVGLVCLVRKLLPDNRWVVVYAIAAGGTLPWLFTLSRISFEVISQPTVWIWSLYLVARTFEDDSEKTRWLEAFCTGLVISLSTFTYSTGRLLSFGLIFTLWLVYYQRKFWPRHALVLMGAVLGYIPYALFALTNPGALTARLSVISYLYDPNYSLWQKVATFFINFLSYFSPGFLLLSGDANARHNVGVSGELYVVVFGLALIGIFSVFWGKLGRYKRLSVLLLLNLMGAAVAAALTEPGHSLRSVLMGIYFLIFSVFGFYWLVNIKDVYWRKISIGLVAIVLMIESANYLAAYFGPYAATSERAFESYNFPQVLQEAIDQKPTTIIVSSHANQPYAHLEFYEHVVKNPHHVAIEVAEPIATPSACILYFISDPTTYNDSALPISFSDQRHYSQLTCFEKKASP